MKAKASHVGRNSQLPSRVLADRMVVIEADDGEVIGDIR